MKKKVVAVLTCAAMTASMLAGCGDSSTTESSSTGSTSGTSTSTTTEETAEAPAADDAEAESDLDGSWPEENILIGMEVYDTTDEQFLALQDYFTYLEDYYNISFMYSESLDSAEAELDFIGSCASAGCKAIIGYYNVAGAEAIQQTIDQGMYYWGTEQYYDEFADNDHYLGCYTFIEDGETYNGDYLGGYELGYSLGKQGVEHVFYCNGGAGMGIQMFIDRQEGFEAGVAAAQAEGAAIQYDPSTDVVEGWPDAPDFAAAVGAKLNGDYDGVAVSFNAAALFQPIMDADLEESIHVATIGEVSETYYDFVQSGMISTVVYDCEEVVFANAIPQILNAVTGHVDATRDADGKAGKVLVNRWTVADTDSYNAIFEHHTQGKYFVTADDLADCLVELNPDATFDSMSSFYNSLDLDAALSIAQ